MQWLCVLGYLCQSKLRRSNRDEDIFNSVDMLKSNLSRRHDAGLPNVRVNLRHCLNIDQRDIDILAGNDYTEVVWDGKVRWVGGQDDL